MIFFQHLVESNFGGDEVTVGVVIDELLRVGVFFVGLAAPVEMKGLRLLVEILNPALVDEYPSHPVVFGMEDEDLGLAVHG